MLRTAVLLAMAAAVSATVFLKESFDDASWEDRWVVGGEGWKKSNELGEFTWSSPDAYDDKGLKTSEDARFYSISTKMDEVDNKGLETLVVAFSVTNTQKLECGGAYIKVLPADFDAAGFGGDSPYGIMFGPDICGTTRRVHVIFTDRHGVNQLVHKTISAETDDQPHLYSLILRADDTYEVHVDHLKVDGGDLSEDFDFIKPKTISDPDATKPEDWVDQAELPDPEDVKPANWDDEPATIPDPDAEMPEDWDEEDDGEWEAPSIDNPEYKGEWTPKMIPNPEYKGPWSAPMIDNPDYEEETDLHHVCRPCGGVGIDVWQVQAGTIFDDLLVSDDIEDQKALWTAFSEKVDKARMVKKAAEEEAKKAAEEAAAAAAAAEEDEDEDDEDEDDEEDEHDEL